MVLIGGAAYRSLSPLPSVSANLADLAEVLRDERLWGIPPANCVLMDSPSSAYEVDSALRQAANEAGADGMLVVYYAGHALIDPYEGDLHLGLRETEPESPHSTALPYQWIRRAMADSTARRRLVILDCAYAGRVIEHMTGSLPLLGPQDLGQQSCVIVAAGRNRVALAPAGERNTAFTGDLVDVLRHGLPGGPALLDTGTVFEELHRRQRAKARPVPEIQSLNGGQKMPLVRNAAVSASVDLSATLADVVARKNAAIVAADWERVTRLHEEEQRLRRQRTDVREPAPAVMNGRLPDRRSSTAVLIGSAEYRDEGLDDIPAVINNLAELADLLTDERYGGFDPERVHVYDQPTLDMAGELAELSDATEDTLLVYYAGHGVVPEDGELYLCLPRTRSRFEIHTALRYDQVRRAVLAGRARNRVIMLDCCFAGRAVEWMSVADGLAAGQLDIEGTYILTATSATKPAHAPVGERFTAFTGALVDLYRSGDATGDPLIGLTASYPVLRQRLVSRGRPEPKQRGTNSVGELALVRNRGFGR